AAGDPLRPRDGLELPGPGPTPVQALPHYLSQPPNRSRAARKVPAASGGIVATAAATVESVAPVVGSKISFGLLPGTRPSALTASVASKASVRPIWSCASPPKPKKSITPICSRLPAALARKTLYITPGEPCACRSTTVT